MAVAFDANLGSTDVTGTTSTVSLTTTAAAAAGSRVVVIVSYWRSGTQTVTGISDGSAYTLDKATRAANTFDSFEIWSRVLVGGLASGSTITVTFSAAVAGAVLIGAASFTGTTGVDTTNAATSTATTAWSSGAATNTVADALFIGGSGNETTVSTTSTPTANTELHDRWRSADQQGFATGYTIASSIASRSISGTWTNSSSVNTGALVIYKGTAAGVTVPQRVLSIPSPAVTRAATR